MEKITYFTIIGDRKKYFKPAPISNRLTNYLKMIESEKFIIDKMVAYREKTAVCNIGKCNLENIKAYKSHIQQMEELIINTISEFKKIEITNITINQ